MIKGSEMSVMYKNAQIVDVVVLEERVELFIETDCNFHLAQVIEIPNDPSIFDLIDIPAYDNRDVGEWIRSKIVKEF